MSGDEILPAVSHPSDEILSLRNFRRFDVPHDIVRKKLSGVSLQMIFLCSHVRTK